MALVFIQFVINNNGGLVVREGNHAAILFHAVQPAGRFHPNLPDLLCVHLPGRHVLLYAARARPIDIYLLGPSLIRFHLVSAPPVRELVVCEFGPERLGPPT